MKFLVLPPAEEVEPDRAALERGQLERRMLRRLSSGELILKRERRYVFAVEAYLRDFLVAAKRIERELLTLTNPEIPPPD